MQGSLKRRIILTAIFKATTTVTIIMCRLGFIMILGALVLLTNLQRADSFSHHRLNAPVAVNDVDSLEHNDDSNEGTTIQPETSIAQSDENDDHLDSEEMKKVKRDTRFLTAIDHSSEEDTTTDTPLDSQSDEHDDDVALVKVVKRDIQAATVDHSVEDDATTEAADQSDERDDIESEEKSLKKRSVHQTAKTILRRIDSSEEDTTDSQLLDSRSEEHSDEKRVVKRDVLQAAVDLSSEEDTTESAIVGSQSDERDDVSLEGNRLVKRDIPLVAAKVDHSSEEDTTDATLLDNQTVENVSSEERLVKRDVNLLASTVDHSSEEHTTESVLDLASLEDSVEDALVRSTLDVKLLPSTALRI